MSSTYFGLHYVIDGYDEFHKTWIPMNGGKDLEQMKKLANKSYYSNNFKKRRIRKVSNEVVWKSYKGRLTK